MGWRIITSGCFLLSALAWAPVALAQQAPTPPDQAQVEPAQEALPELTPEERRLLGESLESDAQQEASAAPAPVVTAQPGAARGQASSNPDISLILDTAASYFRGEPDQLGAHDPNRTGFTLQQLEMHIEHNVDPFLRLDANLVFSQFGVEVEEAYATTLQLPGNLQARAGQFLTKFGRLNPTHPHSWSFLDQPLPNGKFFGGEGSRGLGAELSVLVPVDWFMEVVVSSHDAAGACCARSFYGAQDLGVDSAQDLLYTGAIKQFFPLGDSLSALWGLSMQAGPNPTGAGNRTEIYGSDLYVRYRPIDSTQRESLSWQTEAMLRRRQVPGDVLQDWGVYSQLVWSLTPQWEAGLRYERASGLANDPLDPAWTQARQRATAQATYYPSHFSRLRLQGAWDDPQWRENPTLALMLGLEVLVGAHGAHAY